MELKEKHYETMELFKKLPEVARRHLNNLFPEMSRSTRYQTLNDLVKAELIQIHKHATASYYTLTKKGKEFISNKN